MKIHFLSFDPRQNDENFSETCGSFDIIALILKKGLEELGYYTNNIEEATHVGIATSLDVHFNYPGKQSFGIVFQDTINTIPNVVLDRLKHNPNFILTSLNQHTADLFKKYGYNCGVIGPGIDSDYWKLSDWPYRQNDKIIFIHLGYTNFRSGIDQLIQAFDLAFCGNENVRLIIKDTNPSEILARKIQQYKDKGNDIIHIVGRWTFSQLKQLYSYTDVACNILRFSAHGLPIAESTLCNNLCLAGDFDPSNQIIDNTCGVLLKPEKEVYVDEVMGELINDWGLTDTFSNLSFPERPKIYSYNIEEYAHLLKTVYETYNNAEWKYTFMKQSRTIMANKWNYLTSAQNLINHLES